MERVETMLAQAREIQAPEATLRPQRVDRAARVALGGLAFAAGLVGLFATPDFIAAHFSFDGHIAEVGYVNTLRGMVGAIAMVLAAMAAVAPVEIVENCLLLIAATAFALSALEGGLRIADRLSTSSPRIPAGLRLRRSSSPSLIYENTPGFWEDGELKFNSLGMRDEERVFSDAARNVVVVGDSIEAWRDIAPRELYPRELEALLNDERSDGPFQVVNLGVTGYSLHQKVRMLIERGLAWRPTLAVVGYCLNDPIPAWELVRYFRDSVRQPPLRSVTFLNDRIRSLLHGYGVDLYTSLHRQGSESWQRVERDIGKLGRLQRALGFRVVLVIFPLMSDTSIDYPWLDIHRRLGAVAAREGLVVVDLLEPFRARGMGNVRTDGVHPNEVGHRIAADELMATIRRESLIAAR